MNNTELWSLVGHILAWMIPLYVISFTGWWCRRHQQDPKFPKAVEARVEGAIDDSEARDFAKTSLKQMSDNLHKVDNKIFRLGWFAAILVFSAELVYARSLWHQ